MNKNYDAVYTIILTTNLNITVSNLFSNIIYVYVAQNRL